MHFWVGLPLLVAAVPAAGQTAGGGASLGLGAATVRTETGSSFSAASLSPSLHYTTPTLVAQLSGFVASLPAGAWAEHGSAHVWATTPRVAGRFRLAAEGLLEGQTWTGGAWTAAAHGVGELLWSAPRWGLGIGAGPSTGWIANDPTRFVALRTRMRAWWQPRDQVLVTETNLSVEPTRFIGAWFTDLDAGVTLRRGAATLSLATDARVSQVYGSTGAGSAFLQLVVGPRVSLELGAGSFLRDPYQGFPRGGFLAFGVRLGTTRSASAAAAKDAPLIPQRRGDSLVVQFQFRGAHAVAIVGDWDRWQPRALRPVGGDVWEGAFVLAPGRHYFNLIVDGRTWVVPSGVATVRDGSGGMAAVLLVR